jgi:hypothetical protein
LPRHTHPRPRRTHSRAHVRFQRDRYIRRRWRQAKDRYETWPRGDVHPELIRRERPPGHWWPFDLPRGAFARNPFNHCSCELCSVPDYERRADRRRQQRVWRRAYGL